MTLNKNYLEVKNQPKYAALESSYDEGKEKLFEELDNEK